MDGSSKILTVSYGTFSCTLEGFDDPLGAMRDIAEYFRDLAADDRYFGAEPPTPDVEMLQNIAEREVNRRVEARLSDQGVSLRQVGSAPETVAEPAPEVEASPAELDPEETVIGEAAPEETVIEETAPDEAVVEAPADESPEPPEPVAAVDEVPVEETAAPDGPEDEDIGSIAARVVSAATRAPKPGPARGADTPDTGTGPLTFNDDFLMADEPEDVLAIDPAARIAAGGPAETVAEKLRRIRAVVSRNLEATPQEARVETAEEVRAARREQAQPSTIEAITADLADDEETHETEHEDDSLTEAELTAEASDAEAGDSSDPARTAAELLAEEAEEDTPAEDGFAAAEDSFAEVAPEADTEEPDPAPVEGAEEDDDETARRISEIVGNVTARMGEDSEDDDFEEEPVEAFEEDVPQPAAPGRRTLSRPLGVEEDQDVGRLMDETDNKLNEDDVVRRRRVISQMRAAVAATKADRLVTRHVPRETLEEEERSAYRDDLSQVVRPQAATTPLPSDRPQSAPPLVLVSSQRVDEEFEALDGNDTPGDFVEFARTMGATELDELLEAAAAFTVFGEGQSSFTRPEIMKRVAAVDPTIRMSREDSLRSFGQLLRTGTFRKLERGQFTIDRNTRFHPGQQIAGE
ncbi:MAG: hypothetical protein OIF48_17155 [Silicimonas sp.]|nr:hypothetical protein [Silicimonas sp.]